MKFWDRILRRPVASEPVMTEAERRAAEACARLAATMKPCPELRERRLRQMSPERAERYRRNAAEIEQMLGGVR